MAIHNERVFEQELCAALADNGWWHSRNDVGYDKALAIFPEDVLGWLEDTQPDTLAKFVKPTDGTAAQEQARGQLLSRLVKELDAPLEHGGGMLSILRRGFKLAGAGHFDMCQFKPADNLNPKTLERYSKVRLRVMQQVHFAKADKKSLDLVFFINGLPVATIELKTDLTQDVHEAIEQYKMTRDPKEPIFALGKRAMVHFAVSNREAFMTTKLDGPATRFLPFNMGADGRSGNPPHPTSSPTAYLWERVWQRDSWLNIVGRFMHAHTEDLRDPITGKRSKKETILFPRFHQLEAVNGLIEASRSDGAGGKYLIQHSAGSGKTHSIAWTAHQLSTLHTPDGDKVFDSVIVVTDRTVLDDQLQQAIRQIDAKTGVVAGISNKAGAKSEQLAKALKAGTPIIVVTIQTFPFIFELVKNAGTSQGKKFAIIADEAHSSQTGATASKLRAVLSDAELQDLDDGGEFDIEAALLAEMEGKASPANISFYAFTATPKAKTLEMFGRVGSSGKPEPFHVYTMQQAIEEKFILDVLQNYTPYKVAFRLSHNGQEYDSTAPMVEQSEALKSLMRWVHLHPTNISSKVQIIIEHFRQNVAHLLQGKAKAMVVTGSRKEAVRYKLAFDKYIADHKYLDVKALVAFSGEIIDPESGPDAFTEANMNGNLRKRGLPQAFTTDEYQVMIVANKFQTGFDQPLLVAMYVDKKLSGVTAVQTLSRLNRMAPHKETTYVLDFVNDPEDILTAFEPYYRDAQLSNITDPNIVYDIQKKLDAAGIYDYSDIDRVVTVVKTAKPKLGNNALTAALTPARDRFWSRLQAAQDDKNSAEVDVLDDFKKTVGSFLKAYGFLSQIINYADTDLEKHFIFLNYLARLMRDSSRHESPDLSEVTMEQYAIKAGAVQNLSLSGDDLLKPMTDAGGGKSRDPAMVLLAQAVEQLNQLFSAEDISEADTTGLLVWVSEKAAEDKTLVKQAQANPLDNFLISPDLENAVKETLITATGNSEKMTEALLEDKVKIGLITKLIGEIVHLKLNTA
jgi:type I restriction enzyme R subunit